MSSTAPYIGRFAPSPTGLLHAGSLAAALASWLDARAHGGRWLLRIEDVDAPRCVAGAAEGIARQLAACGLLPDEAPLVQSTRGAAYAQALAHLQQAGLAYPCACTRSEIAARCAAAGVQAQRGEELPYPGTCRPEAGGLRGREGRAWRLHVGLCLARIFSPDACRGAIHRAHPGAGCVQGAMNCAPTLENTVLHWHDRRLGAQQQDVARAGDCVLRRADGLWAYHLAVVVDDGAQGVTHIVRGEDLAASTPRHLLLAAALGLPAPIYLHTPLVCAPDGEKLSKQHGAEPLAVETEAQALAALQNAARALG
ncbi:MAG: tRNA glutamyl-Q(34) synthetase GluQRS, partial [Ottowia sp.]|nr:tRNA glutamyl-Q(34) synthetase GluQRS [Ottowia sp.]